MFKEEREGQRYEQSARRFIQKQVYCHPFKEWLTLSRFSVAILHRPGPVKRRAIQMGDVGLLALDEGRFGSMARSMGGAPPAVEDTPWESQDLE